ncbi:MAG: HEAT repeat domain-containing protein [Anaerolineaceae bacterium]|nr:HEAT repeat domain-containing protein [Anaerolineaceae bacterium]
MTDEFELEPEVIPFETVMEALLDNNTPFSAAYIYHFSDISSEHFDVLKACWDKIDPLRLIGLIEDLAEISHLDTLVSFEDIAWLCINNQDPKIRTLAIQLLLNTDKTSKRIAEGFLNLLNNDGNSVVRAAAASALDIFIYTGELEKISEELLRRVEKALLTKISSDEILHVKRKCLESLGFSSRKEIPALIEEYFNEGQDFWKESAIIAMGKSADPRWHDQVLEMIYHHSESIRFEAIRAAGELELRKARSILMGFLDEPDNFDEDTISAIIWSLSQIGGEGVSELLNSIMEDIDDVEQEEFILNAIENLVLTEGFYDFNMFDIDEDEELKDSFSENDFLSTLDMDE